MQLHEKDPEPDAGLIKFIKHTVRRWGQAGYRTCRPVRPPHTRDCSESLVARTTIRDMIVVMMDCSEEEIPRSKSISCSKRGKMPILESMKDASYDEKLACVPRRHEGSLSL